MGLTQKLGTIPLAILTDASNNIGIGGSPSGSYKLEVTGTIRGTGSAFDFYTSSGLGTSSASGLMRVITSGTSVGIAIGQSNSTRYTAIAANDYKIYNDDFFLTTNGAFPLSIGTNSTARLTISSTGAATFTGDIIYNNAGNQNAIITSGAANNGRMYIYSAGTANIGLQAGNSSWFLNSLGIGTNSPSSLLHLGVANAAVDGTKGVKITNPAGTTVMLECGVSSDSFVGTTSGSDFSIRTNNAERMRITSAGTIFMYNLGGYSSSNADVRFDTSSKELYYQTSSLRYKINIVDLEDSLQKITYLRPVRYQDKNMLTHSCGLIAEEVAKIIPDVVFKKEIEGFDEPQIEGVNYSDFVPFIIKAIQEMNQQNQDLKSRLDKAGL